MQIRIRHDDRLRIHRVVRLAAGVGDQPGRRVRGGHGPHGEHHLPLQDLGDQRGRDEQRLGPDAQNAAQRPDGRDGSGVGGRADHGDAERDREPQRRDGQRLQIRSRRNARLHLRCCVLRAAGVRDEPCRGVRDAPEPFTLEANTTYHFRISATNASGTNVGADEAFKTLPNAPTVVTKAASAVAQTTATLNATVNPNGGEVSECKFEYGTTIAYGSTASCASLPGSGTSPVAVSAAVTGLTANTTYHFRISATNPGGTSKGSDLTFKTLLNAPTVVTDSGVGGHADHGNPERDREPQRRDGERLQIRSTAKRQVYAFSCCRVPRCRGPGTARSPCPRRSRASRRTRPTTSGSPRPTRAARAKAQDETLKTLPNAPTVVTTAASALTQTTATLNATVNPNGGEVSDCKFEYGTTEAYGSTASCASLPGSGTSPVAVSAAVTGLTANTTYHFRISATNAGRHEQRLRPDVQNAASSQSPDGRDRSGLGGHAHLGDPERDGEPQRRRRSATATSNTAPRKPTGPPRRAPRCRGRGKPGRGLRVAGEPQPEHHLPLQDLRDQRERHEQRLRPDVHDARDAAHAALVQERSKNPIGRKGADDRLGHAHARIFCGQCHMSRCSSRQHRKHGRRRQAGNRGVRHLGMQSCRGDMCCCWW